MSISAAFDDHVALVAAARDHLVDGIDAAARQLAAALGSGRSCLAFGNGGSAADAEHFVAELVGTLDRARPGLPALALTGPAATLTSIANDFGWEQVFSRQVGALAGRGDVVVVISTSGRSANVVDGAQAARELGCTVIGLTGGGGGDLAGHCDILLDVPSTDTQRIQELHILCLHALVEATEDLMGATG